MKRTTPAIGGRGSKKPRAIPENSRTRQSEGGGGVERKDDSSEEGGRKTQGRSLSHRAVGLPVKKDTAEGGGEPPRHPPLGQAQKRRGGKKPRNSENRPPCIEEGDLPHQKGTPELRKGNFVRGAGGGRKGGGGGES